MRASNKHLMLATLSVGIILSPCALVEGAPINGNINLVGTCTMDTGGDFTTAHAFTSITVSVELHGETGVYVGADPQSVTITPFTFDPPAVPVYALWQFTFGGKVYNFTATTLNILILTPSIIAMGGTGILHIDGFADTPNDWNLTAVQNTGKPITFFLTCESVAPALPRIVTEPASQFVKVGDNVTLSLTASGTPPLSYQWQFNGHEITGATDASLVLNSVTAASSGGYSLNVSNAYGSAASSTAYLAVLADGANATQPTRVSVPLLPTLPTSIDSLVVITHGFAWNGSFADESWVSQLAATIQQRVPANWFVIPYIWNGEAWGTPDLALINARIQGGLYGAALGQLHYKHIHLIGHSAGAAFVEAAAKAIKDASSTTVVHSTFLAPYLSLLLVGTDVYGANADWSDCYFVDDLTTPFTSGNLVNAFNANVSWIDPNHKTTPIPCPSLTAESTAPVLSMICGYQAISSHGYPVDFYSGSVLGALPACATGYGFPLSLEGGGWNNRGSYQPNPNDPLVLCGQPLLTQGTLPIGIGPQLPIGILPSATSGFGVTLFGNSSFNLSTTSLPMPPQISAGKGRVGPLGGGPSAATNAPAWLAVGLTVTNGINFVQFDAAFDASNSVQGLLSTYWDTNRIGILDERVVASGFETFRFALPATPTNGIYTLSFHLDGYTNGTTSITITNVVTGFIGFTESFSLNILPSTNGTPMFHLTGATGYQYLLQSSSNLVDWVPSALILNTNSAMLFSDPTTNEPGRRFYRALLPF